MKSTDEYTNWSYLKVPITPESQLVVLKIKASKLKTNIKALSIIYTKEIELQQCIEFLPYNRNFKCTSSYSIKTQGVVRISQEVLDTQGTYLIFTRLGLT